MEKKKRKRGALLRLLLFFLCLAVPLGAMAQGVTVRGQVLDPQGEPVIGATVIEKSNRANGTVTDMDGNFTIRVQGRSSKLEITCVGMRTEEVSCKQSALKITLEEESELLNEVVVIGYGTTRRGDLTGAISSVSERVLRDIPITSAAGALTGKLAGVNVVTTDGSPDAEIQITVRGGGSITQDNSPLFVVDGFQVDDLSGIPPGDIENITVLKDASSTAIYGAKGANGVILVTTKSGRAGKMEVTFSAHWGWSRAYNFTEVLDPYEYVYFQKEVDPGSSTSTSFHAMYGAWEDRFIYKSVEGTDWQDIMYGNTGFKQNYNIGLNGGTEKLRFNLSYTHDDEDYIMTNSDFKRDNLSVKLNSQINKQLKFDLTTRLTKTVISGAGTTGGKLVDAIRFSPVNSLASYGTDALAADADRTDETQLSTLNDPYWNTVNHYKEQDKFQLAINGGLQWEIIKGLTYSLRGSYEYKYYNTDQIWLNKTGESSSNGGQPVAERTDQRGNRWSVQNTLQYRHDFGKKHHFDVLFGHEMTSDKMDETLIYSKYYPINFTVSEVLAMWNYGEAQPTYTTLGEPSRTASWFGRANYSYNNRYMLTFTARADGTNVFAPDNRWGFFPGAALAWRVSEEEFMEGTKSWLDNLKVRLSYGAVGNARVGSYWRQEYSMQSSASKLYYPNETVVSALQLGSTLRNENLTWETKISANLGIDATLFNRVNLTVDIYNDTTKDLIVRMDLPNNSGYSYQYQNLGKSVNRGVEISLDGTIINTKKLYIGAFFNIAFNRNKIKKIDGTATELTAQSGWAPDVGSDDFRVYLNKSMGQIYGFEMDGDGYYTFDDFTFNSTSRNWDINDGVASDYSLFANPSNFGPGFIKLKDQDGDGKVDADNDRVVIGNTLPKHTGGFGINASCGGFDLSMQFNWSYGNKIYNAMKLLSATYTNRKYNNLSTQMELAKRWTIIDPETGNNIMYGDNANNDLFASLNSGKTIWSPIVGNKICCDWAVEDGSFLRLSNLTVGYTLPTTLSRRFGVKNFRLYVTANNLFCITGYSGQDPEVSTQRSTPMTPGVDYSAYPKAHSYIFGVNVTF